MVMSRMSQVSQVTSDGEGDGETGDTDMLLRELPGVTHWNKKRSVWILVIPLQASSFISIKPINLNL